METYVIHVTKECNCDCLYCYEDDKTSKYSWKEIKEFINNLIKHKTNKKFSIEFLGGEPMLRWDYIKKVYNYIEKEKKEVNVVSYTITTNGTIMSEEIAHYLKKHPKLHFAISMDGHLSANQFRIFKESRINTYNSVMENIKILLKNDVKFGIHIVSHLYNIAYLSESIDHLYNKGVKSIDVGTIEKTMKIDEEYCNRFIKELDIVSEKMVNGEYPELSIGLFNWIKPKEDVRSYIKDKTGKVVGESYGRSGRDITYTDVYDTQRCTEKTEVSEMIYNIRKTVYENHNNRLKKIEKNTNKLFKKEDISIAFSGHNIKENLKLAIKSFLRFHSNFKENILVFDDISTDGTKEWLKENNIKRISWKNDKYKKDLLKEKNVAYRVNLITKEIIEQAKTKYLLILDGDILILQEFLSFFFNNLENDVIGILDNTKVSNLLKEKLDKIKELKKYNSVYNKKYRSYLRIWFGFVFLNLKKIKEKKYIFDDIDNNSYNKYLNSSFDSGVDFYFKITNDKDLKIKHIEMNEQFYYHFGGKSVLQRGIEENNKGYQYSKDNIIPKKILSIINTYK